MYLSIMKRLLRSHDNPPPQQNDPDPPSSSAKRKRYFGAATAPSSSAKRKRYFGAATASRMFYEGGEPVDKVPLTLYNSVRLVLEARNVWELEQTEISKSDWDFALVLQQNIALSYKKKKLLPSGWEVNPYTAHCLKPKDDTVLQWLHGKKTYPSKNLFKVNDVPLSSDAIESWLLFKNLDESMPKACDDFPYVVCPLSSEHPFVSSLGCFAVEGYNEVFELFVERGNCNRLCLTRVSDCTYYLLDGEYCFTMTVVAAEDGFTGIYEAIVYCCCLDGKRTLKSLSLMDVEQGKKRPASNLKSPKGVCLPTLNKFQTGMFERGTINGIIYGLYDYDDPSELVA